MTTMATRTSTWLTMTSAALMEENRLWQNNGSGCGDWCFTEVAATAGANHSLRTYP